VWSAKPSFRRLKVIHSGTNQSGGRIQQDEEKDPTKAPIFIGPAHYEFSYSNAASSEPVMRSEGACSYLFRRHLAAGEVVAAPTADRGSGSPKHA
jgi:hypothetical protein